MRSQQDKKKQCFNLKLIVLLRKAWDRKFPPLPLVCHSSKLRNISQSNYFVIPMEKREKGSREKFL